MKSVAEIFGINLKRIRKELDLSQEKFAEKIGLEFRNLCDIEKGRHIPNTPNLQKICHNLHILPAELFKMPDGYLEDNKLEIIKKINDKLMTYDIKTIERFYKILLCFEE